MDFIVPSRLLMIFTLAILLPTSSIFHLLHTTHFSLENSCNLTGTCFIVYTQQQIIMLQLVQLVDVQFMLGNHNFDLLKKLVLPDGSVLRAQLPGRPTRDSLFVDPARDGTSLLKMWNMNKCSGVVGVFNWQGAGWCKIEKKTRIHDISPGTLTASVCASDVDLITQVAGAEWLGETIVYAYRSGEVIRLPKGVSVPVTLKVLEFELFHFCPIQEIAPSISFAAIGLLDMFNTGGSVEHVEIHRASNNKPELFDGEVLSEMTSWLSSNRAATTTIALRVRGRGRFGVYSSQRPLKCVVGGTETDFNYDSDTGLTTFSIPVPPEEMYRWSIEFQV